MNNIVWKRVKELNKSDIIEEFESYNYIRLPKELKSLIKEFNGARPSLKIIKIDNKQEVEIKGLLSFNKEDIENIHKVIEYFKKNYNNKILPFATEPSGDYFCINLDDESVVYWKHETNELVYISKNLDEFLCNLI